MIVQVRIENALKSLRVIAAGRCQNPHVPTDLTYDERQYDAEDFHGHRWNFTETVADVEPESWGGTSVKL